jgi:nucleoid-associated protein YgaU
MASQRSGGCNEGSFHFNGVALMTRTRKLYLPAAAAALAVALASMPIAAQQATSPAEAAFKRADANGDGKLSKEEAARLPAIAAKFDELDKDKDGALSMSEFMAGYEAPK